VAGERVEKAIKHGPELLKLRRGWWSGQEADKRLKPAPHTLCQSRVQELLHRSEVVADRPEAHARSAGDIA
jgi:hypothetical protein